LASRAGNTISDFPSVWILSGVSAEIDLQSDPEGNGPGFANVERAVPAGKSR
jgi:hypothetical protein